MSLSRLSLLGFLVLLTPACNNSPTEPAAPSVSFATMSLTQCDGGAKFFGYPEFQYRQSGQTFDMSIAGVGKAHGTISDSMWGTFTITLDAPCGGGGSGSFQLSGTSHGPSIYWRASGSWNVTITEAGPACACPVGAGVARFTLG